MKIGIFDSGIGGLTVLNEALGMIDDTPEYLYYADTVHAPYGTKDAETVLSYAEEITSFLIEEGAEAIVIACNTATSVAAAALRAKLTIPVIGMEPAVKPALEKVAGSGKRVLVMATELTLQEKKLSDLIARYDTEQKVDLLPMPKLVELAERNVFDGEEVNAYLKEALAGFDVNAYGAVVPGCTHFIYFVPVLKTYFPEDTSFIDGNKGTVRRLMDLCGLKAREGDGEPGNSVTYYAGRKRTDPPAACGGSTAG